jgi:hypothetical protein
MDMKLKLLRMKTSEEQRKPLSMDNSPLNTRMKQEKRAEIVRTEIKKRGKDKKLI